MSSQLHVSIECDDDFSLFDMRVWQPKDMAALLALFGAAAPRIGTFARQGARAAIGITPSRAMLLVESGHERPSSDIEIGAVIDVSHGYRRFVLAGQSVADRIGSMTGLDTDMAHMPVPSATFTGIHSIAILVLREAEDRFALFAPTSYAESLMEWLER